jgi:CsoR family transcriptional regulator, copper-sensing transcriptional repressor
MAFNQKWVNLSIYMVDKSVSYPIMNIPYPYGGGERRKMKKDVAMRLRNIEGHIRGIERMVEEGAYCIDVIRQIQAAQAALSKVSSVILDDHLNSCVITAIRGDDPAERERVLKEIHEVFDKTNRPN